MLKWIQIDERAEHVSGKLSFIFLGLTQAGLLAAIFYQRYIQGLPPAYYNDLAIIFGASVLVYWLFSLYLGGVLPMLSRRTILAAYLYLVLSIGLPYTLIRGLPQGQEWVDRLLIILGAPAILIGGYAIVAALGKRRLDRMTDI
jgi:hypothetical protein